MSPWIQHTHPEHTEKRMPTPGTYPATATGASIYESEGGALMIAFACEVVTSPDYQPERLTARQCLVQKDGTTSTRTVDGLKQIFGYDNSLKLDDWLVSLTDPGALDGKDFEVVLEEDTFTGRDGKEKKGISVKYMNPVGGSSRMPANGDRKAILAKYGAKFRALGGGTAVKKPTAPAAPKLMPPPAAAPEPPADPPSDPPAAHAPSTMEEAWNTLNATMAGKDRKEIEAAWFKIMKQVCPGKPNSDLSPEDWGAIKAACEDNVPY